MTIDWTRTHGIVWDRNTKLSCPKCGNTAIRAVKTVTSIDGAARIRSKFCTDCGHEWEMIEVDADRYAELLSEEETLDRAIADVREIRDKAAALLNVLDTRKM